MNIIRSILSRQFASRGLVTAAALVLLSACAVGSDFARPAAPASRHYDLQAEHQLAATDRGHDEQRLAADRSIEGAWWSALASRKLDRVMREAIIGNLDLAAADATIAQADEAVTAADGELSPQLDFAAQGGRQRAANGGRPATSDFYAVGPLVSFDFDLFGGIRRQVEERSAVAELQRHRFDAAYLTVTGNVANQALLLASARAQIDAVQRLLQQDRRTLELIRAAHRYGSATQVDVALAKTQLAQDETLLPPLAQQRDTARHALSILAGKGPADWVPPDFDLNDFILPANLPFSLPSELARDRPDILEAEAALHAASAAVGVATAARYPQLQISASLSATGPGIGTLWGIASGLTAPIFDGGTLRAEQRAAIDRYQAFLAGYRQTVIKSLSQVADVLQAINHDGEEFDAQSRALNSAATNLRLNRDAYRAGEIGVLQVVDAERTYQRALIGRIRTRTAQYLDTVQLAIALGGHANGAFERGVPGHARDSASALLDQQAQAIRGRCLARLAPHPDEQAASTECTVPLTVADSRPPLPQPINSIRE